MNKSMNNPSSGNRKVYWKPQMKVIPMTTEEALLVGSGVLPKNTLDVEDDEWPVDQRTKKPYSPW